MFKKENNENNLKEAETIIGPSVKVKGNFHGQGNMIIEGLVEGSIKTDNYLLVSNKAEITASIEAGKAKIGGKVHGNIKVKGYLELTATAKVFGDIDTAELSIEKGAVYHGHCRMSAGEKDSHPEKK